MTTTLACVFMSRPSEPIASCLSGPCAAEWPETDTFRRFRAGPRRIADAVADTHAGPPVLGDAGRGHGLQAHPPAGLNSGLHVPGETCRFAETGRTGRVQGERPWLARKIAFAVILGLIVAAVVG